MIAHPEEAEAYGRLKRGLAAAHPQDTGAYVEVKTPFIKEHLARAFMWHEEQKRAERE